MNARTAAGLVAACAAIFAALHKMRLAANTAAADAAAGGPTGGDPMPSGGVLGPADIYNLAPDAINMANASDISPEMLTTIAMIESSGDPTATRPEPGINDVSVGLCQVLVSTAQWLANDMGYQAFGEPDATAMLQPQESLYFGAAYLHWLKNYGGQQRSEEWVVRSYNGGPGNESPATFQYWTRYQSMKQQLGFS